MKFSVAISSPKISRSMINSCKNPQKTISTWFRSDEDNGFDAVFEERNVKLAKTQENHVSWENNSLLVIISLSYSAS